MKGPPESRAISPTDGLQLSTSAQRIPELDGLRGLAILMVVLCHYIVRGISQYGEFPRRLFRLFGLGWSGVDLFFVLSGFLIGGILLESRNSPRYFRTFYLRRVHRILPIYYVWLLIFVLFIGITLVLPRRGSIGANNLFHLPYYLVFLQNYLISKAPLEFIFFGATWSLAVEEQFYLCAPVLIRYLSLRRLIIVLVSVVVFAPALRLLICLVFPKYFNLVTFAMPCRADALAYGMLAAAAFQFPEFRRYLQNRPKLIRNLFLGLFLGLLTLIHWLVRPTGVVVATIGYSYLAILFLSLLLFVLFSPSSLIAGLMRSNALRNLGMISYCVYIIHYPINAAVHAILFHAPPTIYGWKGAVATIFAAFLTWVLAMLSWYYIEKPLVRRGHCFAY